MSSDDLEISDTDIAVIGMAGRFPGARSVDELWENVVNGVESIREYSDRELAERGVDASLLRNPLYVRRGAPLDDMEMFDAPFFGFSPKDAAIMDPQHRHFLEVSWEALERAGYTPERFDGSIGVFAGSGMTSYMMFNLVTNPQLMRSTGLFLVRHTGNDKDFLTTRVSYELDLKGPSINVQTACSTSLVAIHYAAQSLLNGECDMALAGGVTIELPHGQGYLYQEGEILAPDGRCRAFDHKSAGTVFGSGVGVVVLKRLRDALEAGDHVHAVIKGSAVNNDGAMKAGYLAPSVDGQAASVTEALSLSGVPAETITYIETHGTGTPVGDPIEIAALTQAFRTQTKKTQFCAIGSIKPNIGHLDTAAGIAGFMKAVSALEHREKPPMLHFERPNPLCELETSPFYVNAQRTPWTTAPGVPRRAGVSSLGVGGTNAHVIIEEAPQREPSSPSKQRYQLLTLSATTARSLDQMTTRLAAHLGSHPEQSLADVAYTLRVGRRSFPLRRVVAVRGHADGAAALEPIDRRRVFSGTAADQPPSIVFAFPGGGAQSPNMGRELYDTEPAYREAVDELIPEAQKLLEDDLRSVMFPEPGREEEAAKILERKTSLQFPAIVITEYALAALWRDKGIEPAAMTGHSLGEYVAACLAGVMSPDDMLAMVILRGKLFERAAVGAMTSVPLSEAALREHLVGTNLDLAVVNGPDSCVASGKAEEIEALERTLAQKDIETSRLRILMGAHSRLLDPILEEFRSGVAKLGLRPPERRYVSNVTGTWARAEDVVDPAYWARHLRSTVRFGDGLATLFADGECVVIEVGPGHALTTLARAQIKKPLVAIPSLKHPKEAITDGQAFLTAMGRLWSVGVPIDLDALHEGETRRRVPLPTYAFDRQRYWMDAGKVAYESGGGRKLSKLDNIGDWFYKPTWTRTVVPRTLPSQSSPPGRAVLPTRERWLVLHDRDNPLADALLSELRKQGHAAISVTRGPSFLPVADNAYAINLRERADYRTLIDELVSHERVPTRIVHMFGVGKAAPGEDLAESQERGFFSLLFLAQAIGESDLEQRIRIGVVTDGAVQVAGEPLTAPEKATVLGPVRVLPKEMPNLSAMLIDVEVPPRSFLPIGKNAYAMADLARHVMCEMVADGSEVVVAYRDGDRFVEGFERVKVDIGDCRLKEGGTYLVTGGLGGVGLELADWLARKYKAKLALVGRRALPPDEEHQAWIDGHGDDNVTSAKIMRVLGMREAGAEVLTLAANVADREDMARVVSAARERFGRIDGVFHAAGVIDDGPALLKEPETAARVLAPKVEGARVLDELLGDSRPDFFVLFSSTSSILGPAGQVDYVAANAFLNAFAHQKSAQRKVPYVAIDWGVWSSVGMAVAIALGRSTDSLDQPPLRTVRHPLLQTLVEESPSKTVFAARYDTSLWLLDEHRLKRGKALVPGTGYVEIVRAALDEVADNRTVEIRDLHFVAPLEVESGLGKDVRITVEIEGPSFDVEIASRTPGEGFREHARAQVGNVVADRPPSLDLAAIEARCDRQRIEFEPGMQKTQQEQHLDFGRRFKNLRWMAFGDGEALACLELAPDFLVDLTTYWLHPALLDLATGFPLPLMEGYSGEHLFVPLGYERIRMFEPLAGRVYSHARLVRPAKGGTDLVSFDYVIATGDGTPLVEIQRFTMKRIVDKAALAVNTPARGRVTEPPRAPDALVALAITDGIAPAEGMEAIRRVLSNGARPQLVVSSLDLPLLFEATREKRTAQTDSGGSKFTRPELATKYEAPRDDVERTLAELWQDLLGVEQVGVRDDFFELGGQSLLAVRLFNKIKRTYQVELPLSTLFEAPTIAQCAAIIREEIGMPAEPVTNGASNGAPTADAKPRASRSRWSSLVPMQPRGDGPPLFCIGGMGGNTLNLRRLAMLLGDGQAFYGLQPPGLDGRQARLTQVEELARHYIREVRQVQPSGPYRIGGYSGGGVAAFEMARQLRELGEQVDFLFFLDSFCPVLPRRTYLERMRIHVERTKSQGAAYLVDTFGRRLAYEQREVMRKVVYRPLGMLFPYKFRFENVEDSWISAEQGYQPVPYDGSATLFRARVATSKNAWTAFAIDESYGWKPFVRGGVEVHEVPGDHSSMCEEPHVKALAAKMRECIARLPVVHVDRISSPSVEVRFG